MEFDYRTLPLEIKWKIAFESNYKTLLNLCKTSREAFGEICGHNWFWKRKTFYDFGDLYDIEKFGKDWWETYQHYRSVFSKEFISVLESTPPDANLLFNMIDVIIERGFLIVDKTDERGNTALIAATNEGYGDIVHFLLEEEGADPNFANGDALTPLMVASEGGHTAIVEMLLNAKADPNLTDEIGWTALSLASFKGHTDIVEMLLVAGANPNLVTRLNRLEWTALRLASFKGHTDIVRILEPVTES